MDILRTTKFLWAGLILSLFGCARPSSPTGGPPDKKPPRVVKTIPETGTTNFTKQVIELHFSEYVERSSLSRSLSLAPNMGIEYELDWGRKSVEVVLERRPPDSTTFILSIDTELKDVHGNAVGSPIKIALSTGSRIDKGKLVGKLIEAETGDTKAGMKVLLYRTPVDLSKTAAYTTESDTGGQVTFPYLTSGTYKAFWLNDRNRNRKWEPNQERAQPFPSEFVKLKGDQTDSLGTIYVQNPDTSRPELMGVGLFTKHRLRLRFSETVMLDSLDRIRLLDSAMNKYGTCYPLYQPAKEPYIIFAHSEKPLKPRQTYHVRLKGLTDKAGNKLKAVKGQSFTGTSQEDTVVQRFIDFKTKKGIYRDQPMTVTYAKPITESVIRDSLRLIAGRKRYESWEAIQIKRNHIQVYPDSIWQKGVTYQLKIWNPLNQQYKSLQSPIWYPGELGNLKVMGSHSEDSVRFQLQLQSKDKNIIRKDSFSDSTIISNLPPMRYRITVYQDRNNNNRWDDGQVKPFNAPEPYFIRSNIPIQPGFTSDLTVQFP